MNKLKLFPFQKNIVDFTLNIIKENYRAFYNAGDVGTGKTFTTIYTLNEISSIDNKVLCVTNGSTRTNWGREIQANSNSRNVLVLYKSKDANKIEQNPDWVVVSYKLACNTEIIRKLLKWKFDYIVLDESQALKNVNSRRTQVCLALAALAKFAFWLSATPVKKSAEDLYPFLQFANTETPDYFSFLEKFCLKKPNPYSGASTYYDVREAGIADLKKLLAPIYIRVRKEDVLDDMPPVTYQKIPFVGCSKIRKTLDEVDEAERGKYRSWVNEWGERETVKIPPNLSAIRKWATRAKSEEVQEFVENLLDQDKSIILSYFFRDSIEEAVEMFSKYNPYVIHGGVDSGKRQGIVDKFNASRGQLLIGQIESMGIGLNIQETCSIVGFCETSFSADDITQCIGRVHRIGQKEPCTAYFFVLQDSIDEDVMDILIRKTRLQEKLL